ncbi:hypothetical protein [Fibrella forsythiae]|uniref:Lipoprotein n=1 Tax=Fibrella forsythiae TaxID=2817061 RepID=A0ABS3JLH2_9BACT|nr:hypothetical protein [Fibrella forsythiae]MBO0950859.1 hypothetical protein [Fibrella forsythiae]
MFRKFLSTVAVAATCAVGFVACNDNNVPAPVSQDFSAQSFLADSDEGISSNEIFDDPYDEDGNANARLAAIDTANQVKYRVKATSACVSGTASVGFKYVEGTAAAIGTVLSSTAVSSKLGYKSFSIKRADLGMEKLKTFDKTKSYTIFIMSAAAVKAVKAVKYASGTVTSPAVAAVPAQWKAIVQLGTNPPAEKALNKAGTKRIGRPITTAVTILSCS